MNTKWHALGALIACLAFTAGYANYRGYSYFSGLTASADPSPASPSADLAIIPAETGNITEILPPSLSHDEIDIQNELDLTGEFTFEPDENATPFKALDYIAIETHSYADQLDNGWTSKAVPPRGWVEAEHRFRIKSIMITNRSLTFETDSVRGISYRFTGTMRIDNQGYFIGGITGEIEKLKNGKVTSKARGTLFEIDNC